MKTVMQELIERYYLFENGEYKPDAFKKHFAEFYPLHLLKEKEQIVKAWEDGDYAYFYSKETGRDFDNGEDYFYEKYKK